VNRAETLERLRSQRFDLLVVGAGIIGSRIAYEAAREGAQVALVDAGDFGAATSSASSKLIHGGLRYLEMGDLKLVREAHLERRALLDRVAPHLVRPQPFVIPIYRGGPHRASAIAAGLFLYSALSGFQHSRGRLIAADRARAWVPPVRTSGMRWAGFYMDAQTHDSRLVLATVTGAARAGAAVLNHSPVVAVEALDGRLLSAEVAAPEGALRVRADHFINAAGPWVDAVRRLEDPAAAPISRLSKGVHLTLEPLGPPWTAALTVMLSGGRVSFAVPWEGMLLLGTTDTDYEGDPGAVSVTEADVAEVLDEASIGLPPEVIARDRIRYRFAGLRALPLTGGASSAAPREEVMRVGPLGMVSVAGGKLTTHRRIATKVLWRLDRFRSVRFGDEPLPGGGPPPARPASIEPDVWEHLVHLYGSEAPDVVARDGLERVHPGGPDVWAQAAHAVASEWALTVDDVVRRRTTLEIRGLATPEVRREIARRCNLAPP